MKRNDFITAMNLTIENIKYGYGYYSCDAIIGATHAFGCNNWTPIHDYAAMFKIEDREDWLKGFDLPRISLKQERLAMLELFKEIALQEKLYKRY